MARHQSKSGRASTQTRPVTNCMMAMAKFKSLRGKNAEAIVLVAMEEAPKGRRMLLFRMEEELKTGKGQTRELDILKKCAIEGVKMQQSKIGAALRKDDAPRGGA